MTEVDTIVSLEASGTTAAQAPSSRAGGRGHQWTRGGLWLLLWAMALLWAVTAFVQTEHEVLNDDGWRALGDFWAHAVQPELSPEFLRKTLDASVTTLAFAVLGTLLSVLLGALLAPFISQTWWAPESATPWSRSLRAGGLLLARFAIAVPRGIHEAVWGLLLLSVLGRDPLVGVLAIAIPFGAITAKVYSELLDEADRGSYDLLRAGGVSRASALPYALLPALLPSAMSYAVYRLECSIRSAVILGMIGAGGVGLQLSLSFQGLQYGAMWTSIYALLIFGALIDRWKASLRRGAGPRHWKVSGALIVVLTVASFWHLRPEFSRWFSGRSLDQLRRLVDDLLPPELPDGGWAVLLARSVETVQMSIVAISLASGLGLVVSVVATRGSNSPIPGILSWAARQLLLLTRAIPPPVWALLVLFVVYPGPLPGALAMGIYTFGVLGRLFVDVVEDLDERPRDAITALGATRLSSFAYATVPSAAGQLISYTLYRWEVTARETIIVGIVGAGGLGRLLEQQRAAFDYASMAGTVCALVVVCLLVDLLSLVVRTTLR